MSPESIRDMYPSPRYRVSDLCYPPGASFDERTRDVTWFILHGVCRLTPRAAGVNADSLSSAITAGEVAEVEAGTYLVEVVGDTELRVIRVFDLAPYMN